MRIPTRFILASLSLGLALGLTQAKALTLGHVLTPDSHYNVAATTFADLVKERTNGELTIDIFPSGQLGGEIKLIQSARTGAVDFVITGEPPMENTIDAYRIFSVPYLFADLKDSNTTLQGPFGDHMLDYMQKYQMLGLAWISSQERNVYGNKRIEAPQDMTGLKIRVIQSPGYVDAYKLLGAQPTPMAYAEVYLGLQTGAIDAGETSPDLMIQDKFAEVSKYYSLVKLHYMPCVLLMSKPTYDKLTPEQQEIVKTAAKDAAQVAIKAYEKDYTESIEAMKARGIEIIDVDRGLFQAAIQSGRDNITKSIPDFDANYKVLTANK